MNLSKKNINEFPLFETSFASKFDEFINKYKKINNITRPHNYYYITIWNLACEPCIDELPILENLSNAFNKNIACVLISSHSDKAVEIFLNKKQIKMENFEFVNDMHDFISLIYKELEVPDQIYPLHVVLNNNGKALAYLKGAFMDIHSTAPLLNFINSLN